MRRTWTIHCHPQGCYWECVIERAGKMPELVRSSQDFSDRTAATLDAQRHGLDPDDPDNVIVRKNYSA